MNKKALFITTRGLIELNENNEPVGKNTDREAISNVVRITEPTHIVYNKNDKRIELDAEAGDIVITFYDSSYPNPMIIVHNLEWVENLEAYDKEQQRIKEEWASKHINDCVGEKCESEY
jgi:hypothetical protein